MEHAAIAANAQRDIEAETPPGAPGWQEVEPDEDDDESDEDDEVEEEPAAPEPEPAPAEQEAQPAEDATPRVGRRVALRASLEQTSRERDEARQIVARAQAELNTIKAADRHILTQLGDVSGYTRNPQTGRFVYEELAEKVLNGQASADEQQTAVEMRQWHELAGPIYREAEQQVQRQYAANWNGLEQLEGIGPENMQQLNSAPDAIAAARALHSMAYQAGQAKARDAQAQHIARLEGELKSLKRDRLSRSPQPATGNGAAVPSGGGWLDQAFDDKGQLREDFERQVAAGQWLGRDLSSS